MHGKQKATHEDEKDNDMRPFANKKLYKPFYSEPIYTHYRMMIRKNQPIRKATLNTKDRSTKIKLYNILSFKRLNGEIIDDTHPDNGQTSVSIIAHIFTSFPRYSY